MEHNLHDVSEMARYARAHDLEVFYQPIEQNYNTPEDPTWFQHSDNWPRDRERAGKIRCQFVFSGKNDVLLWENPVSVRLFGEE